MSIMGVGKSQEHSDSRLPVSPSAFMYKLEESLGMRLEVERLICNILYYYVVCNLFNEL